MKKTNAARLLDAAHIPYELVTYTVDPDDLSAESVAQKIGLPVTQIFKTLCVRGDRHGHAFAVVPGDHRLDPKALAKRTGDRRIEPVSVKQLRELTGYVRGGVTVLGAKKAFPVYVDERIALHERVSISAGERGLQIWLAPEDYLRVTSASLAAIATAKSPRGPRDS